LDAELPHSGDELSRLYDLRFDDQEMADKKVLWDALAKGFFARYISASDTVVDVAAGSCEFINAISARRRIAVDLNPNLAHHAADGVEVLEGRSDSMPSIPDESVDVVFTSNFFEHLPSKGALLATLDEFHRILRPGGQVLTLMPNIRCLPGRYWDYLDHHLPLTERSLAEALGLTGFDVTESIPRFLPYTVKSARMKVRPLMVRVYLMCRPAWWLLGKQMFVAATKASDH
jgi:ubiquinone/menaquinone biosynthesis C-methylase UbiE